MPRESTLAKLITLPALAKAIGVSRWTMKRRLEAVARLEGKPSKEWLFRLKTAGWYRVNKSILKARHPYIFEKRPLAALDDLALLAEKHRRLSAHVNGQGSRIRTLETIVAKPR